VWTDPDSGLGQVGPGGDLLSGRHVRVPVALERGLELLQLLTGEVSSLSSLPLCLLVTRLYHAAAAAARVNVVRRRSTFNDTVLIYTRVAQHAISLYNNNNDHYDDNNNKWPKSLFDI